MTDLVKHEYSSFHFEKHDSSMIVDILLRISKLYNQGFLKLKGARNKYVVNFNNFIFNKSY